MYKILKNFSGVSLSFMLTGAWFLTLPMSAALGQEITLRMGHIHSPSGPTGRGVDLFAEKAAEYSDGRLAVQVFPSSQLGGLKKLFGASRSGAIDLALTPYPLLSDIVQSYSILTAGYVFDDFEHQLAVLNHPNYGQAWSTELAKKGGLEVLANYYFGARTLTTTDTEVRTPADLNGLKIRAVGNPLSLATITGLGANPTPLPFSELFQGLTQGIVDGQENPLPTIFNQKFFDVQKYLILTRHQLIPIPITINAKSFGKLSDDDQKAIRRAAIEAAKFMTETVMAEEAKLVSGLKAEGMEVIGVDQGLDLEAFRASVTTKIEALDGVQWPNGLLVQAKKFALAN